MSGRRPGGQRPGQVRLIAGRWRGRRLVVACVPGLRPTPDRVRETVFNWLAPVLAGAHCLDLFAGTGALGLEALSRGARRVVFVEQHPQAVAQLRAQFITLGMAAAGEPVAPDTLQQIDALAYLARNPTPFDIVFLDPPFRQGLLRPCCERLAQGWLRAGARVYLEAEREADPLELPAGFTLTHNKVAGEVGYHLALWHATGV